MYQTNKKKRRIYINSKQKAFLTASQKIRVWVGGRGSGKTRVIAYNIKLMVTGSKSLGLEPMSRCRIAFLAPTIDQLKTKVWPEIADGLAAHGLREHEGRGSIGHYVMGVKPPSWFRKPRKPPKKFDNIVTFYTGFSIDLLGFHLNNNKRGGSYNALFLDEALEVDGEQFDRSIQPLVRGNQHEINHPLHESMFIFTSRPWKAKARWVDTKMKKLAQEYAQDYFYIESSALDNRAVLGDNYFKRLQRTLSPITYAVEVENRSIMRIPNCFYEFLDEDKHGYLAPAKENDVNTGLEMDFSFDFNAKFTSATVWQEFESGNNDGVTGLSPDDWELRCSGSFFVKNSIIDELIEAICTHHISHPRKVANIYGGADAHRKHTSLTDYTYFKRIKQVFESHGWVCYDMIDYHFADIAHKKKHLTCNLVLKESSSQMPKVRINSSTAKDVLISMGQTPIKGDFKKDKSSELDENLEQQFATHFSDTFDNYIVPKTKNPVSAGGMDLLMGAWS